MNIQPVIQSITMQFMFPLKHSHESPGDHLGSNKLKY